MHTDRRQFHIGLSYLSCGLMHRRGAVSPAPTPSDLVHRAYVARQRSCGIVHHADGIIDCPSSATPSSNATQLYQSRLTGVHRMGSSSTSSMSTALDQLHEHCGSLHMIFLSDALVHRIRSASTSLLFHRAQADIDRAISASPTAQDLLSHNATPSVTCTSPARY